MRRHRPTMERIYELWCSDRPTSLLEQRLAGNADYQSFETRDELMNAYWRWLVAESWSFMAERGADGS